MEEPQRAINTSDQLWEAVERAAATAGVSVNGWVIEALTAQLRVRRPAAPSPTPTRTIVGRAYSKADQVRKG